MKRSSYLLNLQLRLTILNYSESADSIADQSTEATTAVKRPRKNEGIANNNQSGGGLNMDVSMKSLLGTSSVVRP